MDDGEHDFPFDPTFSCLDVTNAESSWSLDIDEFLSETPSCNDAFGRTQTYIDSHGRTQACTHTHTCNPSGPGQSHKHTCIHVHTQIMPSATEAQDPIDDTAKLVDEKSQKSPLGNREAVRKYREKKKARAASLEDEVIRLRALNQQLMKRLQGQVLLEAEVARLKCLLVDIRGRIEGEIGSFPYRKPNKSPEVYQNMANPNLPRRYVIDPCNMQHSDPLHCSHPGSEAELSGQVLEDCGFDDLLCSGNQNSDLNELPDGQLGNVNVNASKGSKRKGDYDMEKHIARMNGL